MPPDLFQNDDDYLEMSSDEANSRGSFARNAINRETFEQMNSQENIEVEDDEPDERLNVSQNIAAVPRLRLEPFKKPDLDQTFVTGDYSQRRQRNIFFTKSATSKAATTQRSYH